MPPAYYGLDYPAAGSHQQQFAGLGLDSLAQHLTFIHENLFLTQPDFASQCQLLQRAHAETGAIPVICLDTNPFENLNQLAATLRNSISTPFFILGCDSRPAAYHDPTVDLWPFWLIQQQTEHNYQKQIDKQHRISFLSGIPKYHRLRLFNKIKPCVIEQDVVVVNNIQSNTVPNKLLLELVDSLPWANRPEYIDIPGDSDYIYSSQQNTHAAYAACVNITAETVDYCVHERTDFDQIHFISEKTWKAYRSGCLVINYGIDTLPDTLRHYGIRIWDDYDICGTMDQKIQRIVDLFDRSDIFDLYQSQIDTVKFNQQLVNSDQFVKCMITSTVDNILKLI
jgi:hypothetical protein